MIRPIETPKALPLCPLVSSFSLLKCSDYVQTVFMPLQPFGR